MKIKEIKAIIRNMKNMYSFNNEGVHSNITGYIYKWHDIHMIKIYCINHDDEFDSLNFYFEIFYPNNFKIKFSTGYYMHKSPYEFIDAIENYLPDFDKEWRKKILLDLEDYKSKDTFIKFFMPRFYRHKPVIYQKQV